MHGQVNENKTKDKENETQTEREAERRRGGGSRGGVIRVEGRGLKKRGAQRIQEKKKGGKESKIKEDKKTKIKMVVVKALKELTRQRKVCKGKTASSRWHETAWKTEPKQQ